MIAAILVGGKGTRLQSVISDIPKPLAPIGNKPFLAMLIEQLASYGISQIVLLTGYMHEKIIAALGDGSAFSVKLIYSKEEQPLGTAGALLNAIAYLKDEPSFLLINGDTYFSGDLQEMIISPMQNNIAMIGVIPMQQADRYGSIKLKSGTAQVEAFLEKEKNAQGLVNAGICRLSADIFSHIPPNQFCSLEQDIFPELLRIGKGIGTIAINGMFYDIGTPESYASFNAMSSSA